MKNIYHYFRGEIASSCTQILNMSLDDILSTSFIVEKPKNEENGDLSSNIALVLSKKIVENPFTLAEKIRDILKNLDFFEEVNVAKPGFINLKLKHNIWTSFLRDLSLSEEIISCNIGNGRSVNIEYVSANPTGPLHVGHCRGAVFGDVLSSLLKATGHTVTKEYYVNDAGSQIDLLAKSVMVRYRELFEGPLKTFPKDLYPGEYLIPVAESLKSEFKETLLNQKESEYLGKVKEKTVALMLLRIKKDLEKLNIHQDIFVSELDLVNKGKIDDAIEQLKSQDLIYQGVLNQPKGKNIDDWEPREQMLFKSSLFGDEIDRPLMKSNGEWTYFANDIAYHFDKYKRGSQHLIDILGADHGGYIKRMDAAVQALTLNKASFTAKLCQMVKLIKGGKQLKMSKRSGDFITLDEMINEVGSDSIRFMMMYRKNEAPLEFDFDKVTEQSKDNPVFYVQYAHARISSVIRKMSHEKDIYKIKNFNDCNFDLLINEYEINLIKKILDWNSIIETSVLLSEPHRIAYYLYELSGIFHSLWNQGKIDPSLRFIEIQNNDLSFARIALIFAAQRTIKSGLDLLGVTAPNEMK